jgi:hypothetical protein
MDKMIIERDVSIPMDDGLELKCDVFRTKDNNPAPVIMTLGPYGKGAPYRDQFAPQWKWLITTYPDILPGSTREFMVWETVDPEIWVPVSELMSERITRSTWLPRGVLVSLS